jgi:hypothetical protein
VTLLRAFRNRVRLVVVGVLQTGSSRILDVMSEVQPGQAGQGHVHEHGHSQASRPGVIERFRHALRPHSHESVGKVDAAMEASAEGMRVLWISLAVLAATALAQAHQVSVAAEHGLLHAVPRLAAALVHADPQPQGDADYHAELASHRCGEYAPE